MKTKGTQGQFTIDRQTNCLNSLKMPEKPQVKEDDWNDIMKSQTWIWAGNK